MVKTHHWNSLYLLSALCMIFMTLAIAVQPLYLRNVLGIGLENAGVINASIQVVTELLDLMLIGYLGFLSDRYGRIPILTGGFIVAAIGALLATFSLELGVLFGIGGLFFYYSMRIVMSLGTGAVWPQLSTLAGDFTNYHNRPAFMAKAAFMMAFGATIVYAVLMQIPQHAGLVVVMLLTAGVALAGAWLSRNCLIDVAPRVKDNKASLKRVWQLVRSEPRLRLSFASAFFARNDMVFIGLFLMLWFVYFADPAGLTQEEVTGYAGMVVGLVGFVVLISIPLWGIFIDRHGRVAAIATGMGLSGLGLVWFGFIENPFEWTMFMPAVLLAAGQAGCLVAPQVLTVDLAPVEMRGSMLGMFYVVGSIGVALFVQLGGVLFDVVGPPAPFILIGLGNIAIMAYAIRLLRIDQDRDAGNVEMEMGGLEAESV